MPSNPTIRRRFWDSLLTVLFFGALWGAAEALVGGFLHRVLPPTVPGHVMLALTMAILAYAVRFTGAPWLPLGMAFVAAPLKLTSSVVYGLPVTAPEVLNPALAMLAEGAAFAFLAALLWRSEHPGRLVPIAAGAAVLQWCMWVGLVRWPGQVLYPPPDVLVALGAKLPPAWALSIAGIASVAPSAILANLVGGVIGGAAAAVPRPPAVALRPVALTAGTVLCLAIFFVASWVL